MFDPMSDSYTENVTVERLEQLLTADSTGADYAAKATANAPKMTARELSEFVHEELAGLRDRRIFNNCVIAFYPSVRKTVECAGAAALPLRGDPAWFSSAQAVVRLGGIVQDGAFTDATTHVVCDHLHPDHAEHVATLNAHCVNRVRADASQRVFKLMPLSWVTDCVKSSQRLDDTSKQIRIR
jgi:hypothetical protein